MVSSVVVCNCLVPTQISLSSLVCKSFACLLVLLVDTQISLLVIALGGSSVFLLVASASVTLVSALVSQTHALNISGNSLGGQPKDLSNVVSHFFHSKLAVICLSEKPAFLSPGNFWVDIQAGYILEQPALRGQSGCCTSGFKVCGHGNNAFISASDVCTETSRQSPLVVDLLFFR